MVGDSRFHYEIKFVRYVFGKLPTALNFSQNDNSSEGIPSTSRKINHIYKEPELGLLAIH